MKALKEIKKENIRKIVVSEIRKAKKDIIATFNIKEEAINSASRTYFALFKKKNKEGIKVRRIIFGSKQEYKDLLLETKKKGLFFTGNHTKSKNYRRMILIDGQKLFFRKDGKFYLTTDFQYVKEFKKYLNRFRQ